MGRKGAVTNIIKKRVGSDLDINDIFENIITNSVNIIQQVENNNILKAFYKQGMKGKSIFFDEISTPVTKIATEKLATWEKYLEQQGVDTSELDIEKTTDIFAPNNKLDTRNLITSFINEDGKRVYLQFNDKIIFNSLMNLDIESASMLLNIANVLNTPLRFGATMGNPDFAIPNVISDTLQAWVYSDARYYPILDNMIALVDYGIANNKYINQFVRKFSPNYANKVELMNQLYSQSGSRSSMRLSQERKSVQRIMKDVYGTKNRKALGIKERFKVLNSVKEILTVASEVSEGSTRFRVFEKNYDLYKRQGYSEIDARAKAALQARDATQDFGRQGTLMHEINKLVPFSAARVGSIYTFAEKVTENPKKTMGRIAFLILLDTMFKAIGYDDDEIEELNNRKKSDNFVVKVEDTVYTIKKPQGVLRSMLNLNELILDIVTGHIEEGKTGERISNWLMNALQESSVADDITGFVPNAVTPLIENAMNKDLYYKSDIVKSYDLDLPDSQQYYDYNSQLAIALGQVFNYSPAKIDNLINGYFGGLGTMGTNAIDTILSKMGLINEKPKMGAEDAPVAKRFVVNVNENSASVDEVYTRKTELTKKQNGGTIKLKI